MFTAAPISTVPLPTDDTMTAAAFDMLSEDPHGIYEPFDYAVQPSASNCIVSPRGLFRVYRYHTFEGQGGVPIAISVGFSFRSNERTYLRILIGRKALNTTVQQLQKLGVWELEAVVPHFDDENPHSAVMPITVQALTDTNGVLDAVTVGSYTYWYSAKHSSGVVTNAKPVSRGLPTDDFSLHRSQSCPSSSYPDRTPSSSPNNTSHVLHRARASSTRSSHSRSRSGRIVDSLRQSKKQALMRTRRFGPGEEYPESHRAVLEVLTPVDNMCNDWDDEELKIGRRLVRFSRVQEGFHLKLSCEAIKQEDYVDGDTVISCIYRADTDSCYVTSVDIIFLLESIVGDGFEIEEKNRIRRNLEGFRPKTVSKNRVGTESFFQQIMDFPAPKPRNIEKDVKVFEWSILPQALEKIISKYSLYYASESAEPGASPSPSSSDFMTISASPIPHPRFISPTASVPDLTSDSSTDDHFLYTSDTYSGGPSSMSLSYRSSDTSIGPYGSLLDSAPIPNYSSSPSHQHRSEGDHSSSHSVYRLMPASQSSSMSDLSIPTPGLYHGTDGYQPYHELPAIRSPVPFF